MRGALALVLVVTVAACSGGETDAPTTTTPVTTSTSSEPTTTTTAAVNTTISPPATTTTPSATTTAPATTTTAPLDTLAPDGSGCTPGPGPLPDGRWYGVVDSYDPQGISFDLACFFSGDAAVVAAAEDGAESPPPNDYYVRNQNETLRQLDIAATVPVTWYPTGDPQDIAAGEFSEWIGHLSQEEFWLAIWVTITDGEVTEIVEQWVP